LTIEKKHIILKISILFLTLILVANFNLLGQNLKDKAKFESLVRLGDSQFDLEYYQNATDFYLRAIEISPADAHSNFYIAECYRILFDYKKAKDFYKVAYTVGLEEFPLSGFYYALMLKYDGNYDLALLEFENFINNTKDISPINFKEKKAIFQRTLIEMEGCYWSIEQLFEYKCIQLPEPVNSVYNDFGTIINKNDTNILIISGRFESKFDIKNDFGEAFTNTFLFEKIENDTWNEIQPDDKFSRINSKFNEGSGVFNSSQTKYFFTSCGREEDGYCKIYFSEKNIGGNWSEPKLLNVNINSPFSDNKQPAISVNEDTLFFVSNRVGGYGENDIWFSVFDQSTKEWGVATNMGLDVNTPFNEVTPFYYSTENMLFFASDGRKGFGGLDIFIGKKDNSGAYIITNLGSPFNSNLDDCYFVLGQSKGYITSNRDGSLGEFDIYSFNNKFAQSKFADYHTKLDELSAKISNLKYDVEIIKPELPEELFTVDILSIYDRILSAKYAALVYNVVLIFTETDNTDFNSLSIDDKSIIDMMYIAMEVDITESEIDSIQNIDKDIYNESSFDEKGFVDKISEAYFNTSGGSGYIKMSKAEKDFYNALQIEDKQRIDRLINFKIRTQLDKINAQQANLLIQDNFGIKELLDSATTNIAYTYDEYESLISKKSAGFLHNNDMLFNEIETEIFNKMSFEDQSLLEMDYKSRAFDLSDELITTYCEEDKLNYKELDNTTKLIIDKLAVKQINTRENDEFVKLDETEKNFYKNLDIESKRKYDRILAYKVQLIVIDSIATMKKNISDLLPNIDTTIVNEQKQEQYEKLVSSKIAGFVYNLKFPYAEPDYLLSNSLTTDDRGLVETVFLLQAKEINETVLNAILESDENNYNNLSTIEKELIDKIAENYSKSEYNSEFIRLSDNEKNIYSNLNLVDKKKIDRLIAYKLSKIYSDRQKAAENFEDIFSNELGISDTGEVNKIFTEVELNTIERLLSYKMAMYINALSEIYLSPDYAIKQNMTLENLSILDMMYASKVFTFKDPDVLDAVQNSDAKEYKLLSKIDREFIERQVELFIFAEENTPYISMNPQDSLWYSNLSIEEKYKTDRMLMHKLNLRLNPPATVLSTEDYLISDLLYIDDLSKSGKIITAEEYYNYERIVSFMIAQKIYEIELPFIENDYLLNSKFTIDDLSIIDLMYKSKVIVLQNPLIVDSLKTIDNARFEKTEILKKDFVTRIANDFISSGIEIDFLDLTENDRLYYDKLTIQQKYQLDRFIAMYIKNNKNAEVISESMVEVLTTDELNLTELTEETSLINQEEADYYERILTFKLACFIYDIQIPFNNLDYELNNKLSFDELSILDMMYAIKTISIEDKTTLDSVKYADEIIYANSSDEDKTFVTEIVKSYTAISDISTFIKLNPSVSQKYSELSVEDKYKTDRLVALKLSEIIKEKEKVAEIEETLVNDELTTTISELSENTDLIEAVDYDNYEKILSFKIANFIYDIELDFIESDHNLFENMSIDDKSLVDMMFQMRTYEIQDTAVKNILQKADKNNYSELSIENKNMVDNIVLKYADKSELVNFVIIDSEYAKKYSDLDIQTKNRIDRIIASQIHNLMYDSNTEVSEYHTDEISTGIDEIALISDLLTQDDISNYEKILSHQIANYIYNLDLAYLESDKNIVNNLKYDDLSIIEMMYTARIFNIDISDIQTFKNGDKLLLTNLSINDDNFINNTVEAYLNQKNSSKIILNSTDNLYYSNLNIVQKNRIDRLIAYKLSNSENYSAFNNTDSTNTKIMYITEYVHDTVYINSGNNNVNLIHDTTYVYNNQTTSELNTIEFVFFDLNSTQLTNEGKAKLNKIYSYWKSNPDISLIVSGYTDDTGSEEYNLELSYDRAKEVFAYLIKAGIPKESIIVNSFGKENPLAPNSNEKQRKLNRRVQIVIIQ